MIDGESRICLSRGDYAYHKRVSSSNIDHRGNEREVSSRWRLPKDQRMKKNKQVYIYKEEKDRERKKERKDMNHRR